MAHASGSFEVELGKLAFEGGSADSGLGRMSIDKHFHGDLEAHSLGQMLSAMSPVKGSAGYVAVERVTGVLAGKRGSFVLQHTGTMNRGTPSLTITVVPDTGTDELMGLSGRLEIKIEGGKHFYEFEYSLGS